MSWRRGRGRRRTSGGRAITRGRGAITARSRRVAPGVASRWPLNLASRETGSSAAGGGFAEEIVSQIHDDGLRVEEGEMCIRKSGFVVRDGRWKLANGCVNVVGSEAGCRGQEWIPETWPLKAVSCFIRLSLLRAGLRHTSLGLCGPTSRKSIKGSVVGEVGFVAARGVGTGGVSANAPRTRRGGPENTRWSS